MKRRKGLAHFSIAALLCLLIYTNSTSQVQKAAQPVSAELQTVKPTEHPITEEGRQLIHEKLGLQRKQLPEWYPLSLWNEIADSIENLDLSAAALPVCQKYVSDDDAKFLIKFMATPQGQKLAQTVLTKDTQSQLAGAAPAQARDQTIAELARREGAKSSASYPA